MTMISLESLPPDIHFQILSHHFEVSVGNRRLASHPYLCLSAVSRSFRYTVESYCYHILQSNWNHLQSSKSTIPRPPFITPTIPTYRQVWLTDAYRRCRFCNASTKSVSSADSSVRCCRRCDRRKCQLLAQWSNKINCSQAAREYGVPEDTILDHLPHAINGDFIMVSKLQVSEFAARFHKVDNIEEYLTARREVCKNVQDHFVAESARLWMERLITLAE
ncbi:hypothetical protein K440DRAFT_328692 [Wilcoxina mikolae CBS 423.85]|nr:hypothetical protein K440DRAFT_328692 [Wilcoxina mikolae CBS 423.85]